MREGRRIALNVIATYGRTLLGVVCGLFSVRWILSALGKTDYGLLGVVGGLIGFVAVINAIFSGAIARFYAYAIGESRVAIDKVAAIENCRSWFSVAVVVHIVLPVMLLLVGYPLGIIAIENGWIVIPADKIYQCIWVWRFSCIASFVSMAASPITAMYQAKQNIAEMTIYSVIDVAGRTIVACYMAKHPGDWLDKYALALCLCTCLPILCYTIQAFYLFPECRFRFRHVLSLERYKKIATFAGWQGFAAIGFIARSQGLAIIVNRGFGAVMNASMTIGANLSSQASSLSNALKGAFIPAITAACGEGAQDKMENFSFKAGKFGVLLLLIFAIPLSIEVNYILKLWLVYPPEYSAGICVIMLIIMVCEKLSLGHAIAINAKGKIALTEFLHGILTMLFIPLGCIVLFCGGGVYIICVAMLISVLAAAISDIVLARKLVGFSIGKWLTKILIPISGISILTVSVSILPQIVLPESFGRLALSTVVSLLLFTTLSYNFSLDAEERLWIKNYAQRLTARGGRA